MKLTTILNLLAGAILAGHLPSALAQTSDAEEASLTTISASRLPQTVSRGNEADNRVLFSTQTGTLGAAGQLSRTITLTFPAGTEEETLKVVLNGKDVSSRFVDSECGRRGRKVCATGTLTEPDGLRPRKNVLYAVARKKDGSIASSRLRFAGTASDLLGADGGTVADTNFLPPTVSFNTQTAGGWNGQNPWIQIGNEQLPSSNDQACSSEIYSVIVLDRSTLEEVNGATRCVANASSLSTYLGMLTSDEVVIVGTNWLHNADANLDTTAIGGTKYTMQQTGNTYPRGYIAIGAGGVAPGSAYENYYTDGTAQIDPFAKGILEEDSNGNYNFEPSGTIEYRVTPNDKSNNNLSTLTLYNTGSLFRYNAFSYPDKVVFFSPTGKTNGHWLLKLQRADLDYDQNSNTTANTTKQETDITNIGTFYPTGASDVPTQVAAFTQLATDLNNLPADQLAILVSVGTPQLASGPFDMAQRHTDTKWVYHNNYGDALEAKGGVPISTLNLYNYGSAYSLITCTTCGNPLNGHVALSSTAYAQQNQTGALHGILQQNLNGQYWPTRTSQETAGSQAGANYTLDAISSEQPVEWPELSGQPLAGASTAAGQVAAYHYASYMLLTQRYINDAKGDYLDDIHYYFTGSLNTDLDASKFDPVNLPFPGQPNSCYTWTDPVTNFALTCFTQQDFQAVTSQLSKEIVDLDNVLVFMVTGTTNMKDIVASGTSSAALALIGAASSIEASSLQPPPASPITTNDSNILNLVSTFVNLGLTFITDGMSAELAAGVTQGGSIVGSLFGGAATIDSGLDPNSGGGSAPLPSPQYTFTTTLGNLANDALQDRFSTSFDTELDTILGDWGKLSQLGPMVVDTSNPAFYFANQTVQDKAKSMIANGSQSDFYLALLPSFYSVQYWPAWFGVAAIGADVPDMGDVYSTSINSGACNSWYKWYGSDGSTPDVPPYVDRVVPTYGGVQGPWNFKPFTTVTPVDHYILAGAVQNPGHDGWKGGGQAIPFISNQVANQMFSASALNIPFDEVVTKNGPLAQAGAFKDASTNDFYIFPANQVASCYTVWNIINKN